MTAINPSAQALKNQPAEPALVRSVFLEYNGSKIQIGALMLYLPADIPPAVLTSIESSVNSIMLKIMRVAAEMI